jgi:hypothetical protein
MGAADLTAQDSLSQFRPLAFIFTLPLVLFVLGWPVSTLLELIWLSLLLLSPPPPLSISSSIMQQDEDYEMAPPSSQVSDANGLDSHEGGLPFPGAIGADGEQEVCYMDV